MQRLALILAVTLGSPVSGAELELRVEGPDSLADEAARVQSLSGREVARLAAFVGLDDGAEPIRVVLAEEGSETAESAPAWVSGWAWGALGTVVLLPERAPTYPDRSLEELLRHELTHVLTWRASGGFGTPRWFSEGVAMAAAGTWGLEDRSRLTLALLFRDRLPLAELDARFAGDRGEVFSAYAVSGAMVREIVRVRGPEAIAATLAGVRLGLPFPDAFHRAVGADLAGFEEAFWRRYSIWYRWLPIVTSSFTLWVAIVLLALWAGAVRRRKRAEQERAWELEERVEAPRNPPPPVS